MCCIDGGLDNFGDEHGLAKNLGFANRLGKVISFAQLLDA